jgi:hypothetical protein
MGEFNDSERLVGEEVLVKFPPGGKTMTRRWRKHRVIMKKFQRWSHRKVQNFVDFNDEKLKVIENNGESFCWR